MFERDYIPEQIVHRDAQLREIAFAVRPGLKGLCPHGTVLRGLPGTGKTTSVRRIFSEIEETTKRLIPIYVNCQVDRTQFAVYSRIYQKLFGNLPRSTGSSLGRVMDEVAHGLVEGEHVLVVCLDDANYLLPEHVLNDVLYTLVHLHESCPGARTGVIIALSNLDLVFSRELDPCVYSTFLPHEVSFPPYSRDEIRGILNEGSSTGSIPVSFRMICRIISSIRPWRSATSASAST